MPECANGEQYLWQFIDKKDDLMVVDSFVKANSVINNPSYERIFCSISGGSDSDVMLDLIHKVDKDKKVKYVWFDTGLEYKATKDHIKYLEKKYGIEIIKEKAIKPIPLTCKENGIPFISKYVSQMISRLQKHGFKFEDKPYEELIAEYPTCKSALKWWCNCNHKFADSMFNIARNKYLKEFMIKYPPQFKISDKCCKYEKKDVSKKLIKRENADLMIIGVRKAEGGIRAAAYKNCYTISDSGTDKYRPLFWYSDESKRQYENKFGIVHSDCYKKYGFKRTGCCCCPYGREIFEELKITEIFEPKLYKAVCNVFGESYEYTRKYRAFAKAMKREQLEGDAVQMNIFDYEESEGNDEK